MTSQHRIEKALETGYDFQPSKYITKAWDTFKDYPGHYIGFVIITVILSMLIGLIPYLSQIYSMTIGAALGMGFAIFTYMVKVHKDETFERFFGGLKFILPITGAGIIQTVILLVIASPLIYTFRDTIIELMDDPTPENIIAIAGSFSGQGTMIFIVSILAIYVSLSLRWAPLLVVFHEYSPLDAIRTSFSLVNKNILGHLILFILFFIVAILGVLAFFVGLLAAIPVIHVAEYYGFAEVTGLEDDISHDMEEMGQNDMGEL